jgi:hypothetical protein|tara:strand:+ start:248 stop:478 length:231 start_codon:yes stop_codon:yes gene_type:complete
MNWDTLGKLAVALVMCFTIFLGSFLLMRDDRLATENTLMRNQLGQLSNQNSQYANTINQINADPELVQMIQTRLQK